MFVFITSQVMFYWEQQLLVWDLCPSGALCGSRSSPGGNQHGVERPQCSCCCKRHHSWSGFFLQQAMSMQWCQVHADLIFPQSEWHILIAVTLTRGCGHAKLISLLQEQGRVHQEEAVTLNRWSVSLCHRHQTLQDIVYRLRESTVMFSFSLLLQENVLVETDVQITAEHQRVLSTLRQQMDCLSRTLLLMRWRETLISPNRRETKTSSLILWVQIMR